MPGIDGDNFQTILHPNGDTVTINLNDWELWTDNFSDLTLAAGALEVTYKTISADYLVYVETVRIKYVGTAPAFLAVRAAFLPYETFLLAQAAPVTNEDFVSFPKVFLPSEAGLVYIVRNATLNNDLYITIAGRSYKILDQ